jgi:hypothetical protein
VHTGRRFTFDGHAEPHLRLGFAPLDPAKIREAIAILTSVS